MNNLANLVQYKSKYGDICHEIENYYNSMVLKEKEQKVSESSKSSIRHPKIKQFINPKEQYLDDDQPENVHFNSIRTLPGQLEELKESMGSKLEG